MSSLEAPLHITFCTLGFSRAARELGRCATSWGLRTRCYTPRDSVVRELPARHPSIMRQHRGAGYWLWKPAIILDALRGARDGEIVLYTDAGLTLVDDPQRLIRLVESDPIALFEHPWRSGDDRQNLSQRRWTKRDCFVLLNADSEDYWNRPQLSAAFQVYRNSHEARSFVEEWLASASDDRVLTDSPNTMGLPNFVDFVDHRHDQSVLTIMATRHHISAWPNPAVDGELGPRVIDHYRRRPSEFMRRTAWLRAIVKPRRRLLDFVDMLKGGGS